MMVKAVILAAGKSTRMHPLTLTRPKPLLPLLNTTIIEHTLEQIHSLVSEIIIIIGYKKEMILDHLGSAYKGVPIRYVVQREQLGTGHALGLARSYLDGRFIVLNGDDLYHRDDIQALLSHRYAILVYTVDDPTSYGIIKTDGYEVTQLIEKPKDPLSNLANTGVYVFDDTIFDFKLKKSPRGEYEIVDYVNYLIAEDEVNYHTVKQYWLPIGYPWQLLGANEFFSERIVRSVIKGKVEKNVTLKGKVIIEEDALIKSGSYIEGPVVIRSGCVVGPNCYLRKGTVLGKDCKVGNACEVKNSIFFDGAKAGHLSYVSDSILGYKVNLGAGTLTANLRHDGSHVRSIIKDRLISSGRRKYGAILADHVKTGTHTSIYPGRKMWPHTSTVPGQIVNSDITSKADLENDNLPLNDNISKTHHSFNTAKTKKNNAKKSNPINNAHLSKLTAAKSTTISKSTKQNKKKLIHKKSDNVKTRGV